jgi:epoxide hydrolase
VTSPGQFAERDDADIVSWNEFEPGSSAARNAPDLLVGHICRGFRSLD